MDSEIQPFENQPVTADAGLTQPGPDLTPAPPSTLHRIFVGPQGLRAGWSVAIFFALFFLALLVIAGLVWVVTFLLHHKPSTGAGMTPIGTIIGEGSLLLALICAGFLIALMERRRILDYNLRGTGSVARFASGLVAGFAALSALAGGLYLGGWLHFGPVALTDAQIFLYAALWAAGLLCVGFTEEGFCRCYLQFTLTRGINFWWALGVVAVLCGILAPQYKNESAWGVWFFAAAGLLPCLGLYLRKAQHGSFWYAAWATSTFFGFIHTGNNGENWIGIFAAAAIGFVFCVSIYVTGSAWWAIGCHAAWDWAETFFYGTADSGQVAKGHFLTSTPSGPVLWSGGTDGPEGSLLVLPAILLILAIVLVQYGRPGATRHSVNRAT
ncbi:CPBP family intramembrane glutamic endopeptidase [Terracidiphilus gabretensis]|uniref:CPBP family intramembrane glutamic endopeptidase n=1 Tax=Terracidiphilus gabretensis TaxID=1577687 RepID=UPI00071B2196|nr:CPBP family intramembrane glutamic endopeptidase [Terracidiphilus gabretensis]